MARIGDPFSQTLIDNSIDRDGIWGVRFALHCRDDTPGDPVMDDPQADAISLTNLTNSKGSGRRQGAGDMVLVANPTYHFEGEWLAG
jgi:hypothetical protein